MISEVMVIRMPVKDAKNIGPIGERRRFMVAVICNILLSVSFWFKNMRIQAPSV